MSVVEMLVLMTVDGDARLKTVCDPCNPFLRMYAHNFLVSSVRRSGDPPTTLANKSSGLHRFHTGRIWFTFRFGVFSHAAVNSPPENCNNILQVF
jgi:hypothetical protein